MTTKRILLCIFKTVPEMNKYNCNCNRLNKNNVSFHPIYLYKTDTIKHNYQHEICQMCTYVAAFQLAINFYAFYPVKDNGDFLSILFL